MQGEQSPAETRPESASKKAAEELVPLPNSDTNLACLVNLNGYAVSYPVLRWIHVPLVTDLLVHLDSVRDPRARFEHIVELFGIHSPQTPIGTYISGGRVESTMRQYPPDAIQADLIPKEWMRPGSNRVDLSNREASELFADLIVAEAKRRGRPILFLDNIVHPSALRGWFPWKDTCRFLRQIRTGLNAEGIRLIANIAVAPWVMPDEDVDLLTEAVDGMSFEMPYHRRARGNRERTQRQINVYRRWLEAGKVVVLIPVLSHTKDWDEREREARFVAAFAMMVRNPGDAIFLSWVFYRPQPDWTRWPKLLGAARDDWRFEDDHILVRTFERGTITIDTSESRVEVRGPK